MLVYECPVIDVAAVIRGKLRIFLTEIGEDGIAFGQFEVGMGDEGDLSERIHG